MDRQALLEEIFTIVLHTDTSKHIERFFEKENLIYRENKLVQFSRQELEDIVMGFLRYLVDNNPPMLEKFSLRAKAVEKYGLIGTILDHIEHTEFSSLKEKISPSKEQLLQEYIKKIYKLETFDLYSQLCALKQYGMSTKKLE